MNLLQVGISDVILKQIRLWWYTHVHLWFPPSFLAVNHHNNKSWVPFILTHNLRLIFMVMKQNFFFFGKKIQNGRLKKNSFFKIANSRIFFMKISQMGPWVSRIEWCEGHWCSSTYMAVRLSDKSSKTAKKCIFCTFWLFLSFCRTASRPYTLNYINALCIIQSY